MAQTKGSRTLSRSQIKAVRYSAIGNHGVRKVMGKWPLVSIVVLNWNGERVIRSSLDSIERLDYPNIEVLVVDNGSSDSSVDIIKNEFPAFQLIRNEKNLGFSAGMNTGISKSMGDLILLYNNDAVIHPMSLQKIVDTITSTKKIGMVGGLILYSNPSDTVWSRGGKLDAMTGTIWSDGLGEKVLEKGPGKRSEVTDIDYLSGCVLLVKREVIERIGLLDEEAQVGGQDVDWCLKARRAGYECVLNPAATVWHTGSFSSRQTPLRSYAERQKSDFRVIMLHFPFVPMISALLFQLAIAPLFDLFFLKQSGASLRSRLQTRTSGFCENLKNLRKLVAERRQIAGLGSPRIKIRTFELLRFAMFRLGTKEFYMGKFLQKTA